MPNFPPLAISPYWSDVQQHVIDVIDLIPEDKLNWTPHADLWNARGILIHIADARDQWLATRVVDGESYPNIWATVRTTDDIRRELQRTFIRLERFLSNQPQLDATYASERNGKQFSVTGHWIAFHLLEHDIHHRAELLQRVALLGIPHDIDI